MATYAIGDVQGCYEELSALLDHIRFDESVDRLWFAGDLVNRGPRSVEVLRLVKNFGERAVTVLGNHDLHLLAASERLRSNAKDTFADVLEAGDRDALLSWLRGQALFYTDPALEFSMVHGGLPPQWRIEDAARAAAELERCLRGPEYRDFLAHMYGNSPDLWREDLQGHDRLRFITNAFTRMRYCRRDGALDLHEAGPPGTQPPGLVPWYQHPDRKSQGARIVFGHWATLPSGDVDEAEHNVFHIDEGCVWGGALTALRLEDLQRFSVPSRQPKVF
jgi:bis(5'-nucleosyl)-tetraphosphatase (symmetrical)